jgi:hypothetical protein
MKFNSIFVAMLVIATPFYTWCQSVSGYSNSIAIHIEKQVPVSGISGQTSINITPGTKMVSGISAPVNINIPETTIHKSPEQTPTENNLSDVDQNIPKTKIESPNTLALVIGNEDYVSHQTGLNAEVNVDFAKHDAEIFRKYLINTLGVPEKNIQLLTDAGMVEMKRAINKIKLLIKAMRGNANVIVYYAGHGLPHDKTKEPYLIPVDISANDLNLSIKLADLYAELTEFPSQKVVIFLDACFSGGAREQGLLAARGVKIKPKEEKTAGNLVVFAATSGNQSALPYKSKNHGLFTYYLLKALQENKGKINLGDLSEYLISEVSVNSLLINSREQTPKVNKSPNVGQAWFDWMLY